MRTELKWWIENVESQVRKIRRENPKIVIQTDSSNIGWGAVMQDTKTGGRWCDSEKTLHINALEIRAILFALKAFASCIVGKYVKILSDSTTAVCYVNHFGGIKSDECNEQSKQIWHWCIDHDVWIICSHIPDCKNEADEPSRQFKTILNGS